MKNLLALLVVGWMVSHTAFAQVKTGRPAPDFAAKDINGKTHRLSDYQGRLVVIEALNLDSPYCANHYVSGAMQQLQAAVASKGGVWLIVSTPQAGSAGHRTPDAARKEISTRGIKATAWLDDAGGAIAKLYGIQTTPQLFVIDGQGTVAYQGAVDDRPATSGDPRTAKNYVKAAVESLLAGKPVAVAETKPYGTPVASKN